MGDIHHVDQVLTGLRVIGMIKEGQKVSVRDGLLNIDMKKRGVFHGLFRWINNDNRQSTLTYIRNVVSNAMVIADKMPEHLTAIDDGLDKTLTGLSALAVTYNDDAAVTASITVLKDRIVSYRKNIAQ